MMQSPAGVGPPSAQGGDGQQQWVIMQQQPQQAGVSQSQQIFSTGWTKAIYTAALYTPERYLSLFSLSFGLFLNPTGYLSQQVSRMLEFLEVFMSALNCQH
jgi:hypothetical protein